MKLQILFGMLPRSTLDCHFFCIKKYPEIPEGSGVHSQCTVKTQRVELRTYDDLSVQSADVLTAGSVWLHSAIITPAGNMLSDFQSHFLHASPFDCPKIF